MLEAAEPRTIKENKLFVNYCCFDQCDWLWKVFVSPRSYIITPRAILPCERLKNKKTLTSFTLVSISLNAARMQRKREISTQNVFEWSDNCINNLGTSKII